MLVEKDLAQCYSVNLEFGKMLNLKKLIMSLCLLGKTGSQKLESWCINRQLAPVINTLKLYDSGFLD